MEPNIDEPVHLRPHDPAWPELFAHESTRILASVEPECAVEHIGSTAVSGLDAKPIIDIMIGVSAFSPGHPIVAHLVEMGYESLGETGIPGRLYFRRRSVAQPFNVHVVQHDGLIWCDNVALRDYLLVNPEAARRYADAKRQAADNAPQLAIKPWGRVRGVRGSVRWPCLLCVASG